MAAFVFLLVLALAVIAMARSAKNNRAASAPQAHAEVPPLSPEALVAPPLLTETRMPATGVATVPAADGPASPVSVFVTISTGHVDRRTYNVGDIQQAGGGGWVLNPRSAFVLTLTDVPQSDALAVRSALDGILAEGRWRAVDKLTGLVARTNCRCAEIDSYTRQFKPEYVGTIEEAKSRSPEWPSASERDREDLLTGFSSAAIAALSTRPRCDLQSLFEDEPCDVTIDDTLIDRYGFDNLQIYFRHADRADRVRTIPADHFERQRFDALVRAGLARSGADIPLSAAADSLRLKDINELVADVRTKPFGRKAPAVDFLVSLPDATARLGRLVAFRELFQLQPLPEEFASLDLGAIARGWRYARVVAELMADTFAKGMYAAEEIEAVKQDPTLYAGWTIEANEDACAACKAAATRRYAKSKPPRFPVHVGCQCYLARRYGDT